MPVKRRMVCSSSNQGGDSDPGTFDGAHDVRDGLTAWNAQLIASGSCNVLNISTGDVTAHRLKSDGLSGRCLLSVGS